MSGGQQTSRRRSRYRGPGVLTFLRWEWALQWRTLRFRLAVGFYLALVPVPAVVIYLGGERIFGSAPGPVTFLIWTQMIQVLLSIVVGCAVGGHRAGLRSREEMWPVLAASPLSNAGYGLRRSTAVALLMLPITALGTLTAAGLATLGGAPPTSATRWLVIWLLLIYLPAAISAAAWRTLVGASGSEMVAAILALVSMNVVGRVSDWTKDEWGRTLGTSAEVFGFSGFQWATFLMGQLEGGRRFGGIASEAPFDVGIYVSMWWTAHGVTLGLMLAVALAAPLWLGRTRRDLPPLRLAEDHWLRSLGPKVYGFVQRLVPDAGLRELRWLPLLVLGAAAVPLWLQQRHAGWVFSEAERRFEAEQAGAELPVTEAGLVMTTWRSEGEVSRDAVDLRWSAEFRLTEDPVGVDSDSLQLAFTLDPAVDAYELSLDPPWQVDESTRQWDRWLLTISPRPEPGESFRLSAKVRGRPGYLDFGLDGGVFSVQWDQYQRRGRAFGRSDPGKGRFVPTVNRRSVRLWAGLLGPVPRYSTWELTPKPVLTGERGWEVPEESSSAASRVELDLTFLPGRTLEDRLGWGGPGLVVASSCGGMSSEAAVGEPVRLVESCDMPAHDLLILGGRWVRLGELPVLAAAFPRDREKLEAMLPELRQTVAASSEAWPGYPGIDRMAVVESAPGLALHGADMLLHTWDWSRPQNFGRMVRFSEQHMSGSGFLDPAGILDGILGAELASSRRLEPEQRYMLRSLLSSLMKSRMGVARDRAVLGQGIPEWSVVQLKRPLLTLHPYHGIALSQKVPAVVLQLERRLGMETLVAAVAEYLARDTDEAATAEELFELLEAHSGEDLDGLFHDYFTNGYLPQLELVDVRSLPRRGGFRITGAVLNRADGEVECPVVVRTDGPELRQNVFVPGGGRGEFSVETAARPQVALLDPDGLCMRLSGGGGSDAERVSLQ